MMSYVGVAPVSIYYMINIIECENRRTVQC